MGEVLKDVSLWNAKGSEDFGMISMLSRVIFPLA